MRKLLLFAFLAALTALQFHGAARADSDIKIEAVIWQFDRDYPGAEPNDLNLPIKTVYIKTHDGADWMSTYDPSPNAVSGTDSLRNLIANYSYQGIDVIAWFVPSGTDIDAQVARAEEVLDTGVKGLYADVEPYDGFCADNCGMLAEQFWKRLRAERPNAQLGVTYDPRTQWQEPAALSTWLSVADVAAPDCYWESFSGQGVWGEPGTCLLQAHADLLAMTPGRNVEFAPMLQGATSGPMMRAALDTALSLGASRVSLWRRGVVPSEVWNEIRSYIGEVQRPCWVTRSDNCLIQEPGNAVWLLEGGARFGISSPEVLHDLGYDFSDVNVVPAGFTDLVPLVPREGALLGELYIGEINLVYAGGRFPIPDPDAFNSVGLDWGAVRVVPPGGLSQIPSRPADYNRFSQLNDPTDYTIVGGKKLALDNQLLHLLRDAGGGARVYTLWDGALNAFPDVQLVHGDASCDGKVDAVDALRLLQTTVSIPNLGICAGLVGNVDCDGDTDAVDALKVLRWLAGIGRPAPMPEPTPTPTESPSPAPGFAPSPTATVKPSPTPEPTVSPTPDPCPPIGSP